MKAYLFLLSFIGLVPATLSLVRPVGHKYYLTTTMVTWPVAQQYCRETYEDLATIESELDWLRLTALIVREGLKDVAWVGLYNIDDWCWSFNGVPLKNAYNHWSSGEPNNAAGNEACITSGPLGYWSDYPCTNLYPFICFNANNSIANRYIGITTALNWTAAQAYCREFYTDLATISSATENSAMKKVAYTQGMSWIGLYRYTWMWSDGTNTSNLLWLPGQPDNYPNENCAGLNTGMFQETICSNLYYSICHITHPVRERQILKLHLMSDVSVFNSDVQSRILELVKQKLADNGMLENTTVTWRVQSDGQIFHKKNNDL